jgi:hypothetical protein
LKAYYEEGQGTVDPVLIGLRPGSYVPVFRGLDAQPAKHREEIVGRAKFLLNGAGSDGRRNTDRLRPPDFAGRTVTSGLTVIRGKSTE